MIKKFFHAVMACGLITLVMSCEDQKFNNINVDVDKVELDHLTPEMVRVCCCGSPGIDVLDPGGDGSSVSLGKRNWG